MAGSSVQLSADVTQFKQGIADATASVKALDAAIKYNEKSMQSAGKTELLMASQSATLNQKLQEQQKIVKNAQSALEAMEANGVSKSSRAYQEMNRKLIEAQTAIMDTTNDLNALSAGEDKAAQGAEKVTDGINGISRKISLDQVINGINRITNGLENAARKAVDLGQAIWSNIMDSAKWADDVQTQALMYDIPLEKYLQMLQLTQNGLDTTVDAILQAQSKLNKQVGSGSDSVMDTLRELGLLQKGTGKYDDFEFVNPDSVALFWEAGQAIMSLGDAYEQEDKAQRLFGRSWKELKPLFKDYQNQEQFAAAMAKTNTNTEEEVSKLAELNDKVAELEGNFDVLERKIMAGLAPALTKGAEALSGLLDRLIQYLDTPQGQQMLENLETAVTGLFEDLATIDPEEVVSGFVGVFEQIINGLDWLVTHKDAVISALEGIFIGWGTLKLTGGAMQLLQLINGAKDLGLFGGGGSGAASAAGSGGWGFGSSVAAGLGNAAGTITSLDPTGAAALILPALADQTVLGRTLRDGGSIGDALSASLDTIEASAKEGFDNFISYFTQQLPDAFWGLFGYKNTQDAMNSLLNRNDNADAASRLSTGADWRPSYMRGFEEPPEIDAPVHFVVEDAEEDILSQLGGPIIVPARFAIEGFSVGGNDTSRNSQIFMMHANGIWSVPYDGYLSVLHKNERVVPAREVESRNFSSNLYVESMIMNNGTDADGLASAMAAAQRREMSGYGS